MSALVDAVAKKVVDQIVGESSAPAVMPKAGGYKIVVADRGWVWAGDVTIDGDFVRITNAVNIRQWGTTKGLGELATGGKTANTVVDAAGSLSVPMRSVVALIDCKPEVRL